MKKKPFKVVVTHGEYGCGDCPFYSCDSDYPDGEYCSLSQRCEIGISGRKKTVLPIINPPGNWDCPLKKFNVTVRLEDK